MTDQDMYSHDGTGHHDTKHNGDSANTTKTVCEIRGNKYQ